MVKTKLVDALISDGARLLHELDRQNFPVESMFWSHLQDEDYWRLIIASPIVAQQGGTAGYRRLNELLQGIQLAGITLEDISLLDPESPQFQSLFSQASASSRLAAGSEWLEFEDAVVYRWSGASVSAELTCEVSSSELNQFWEAERRIPNLNLPALLISLEKGRVTLRFHPQHGPLGGIEEVKKAFLNALHRPNARQDCQVHWTSSSSHPGK